MQDSSKICPFCAETIKAAAIICRYCRSDVATKEKLPEDQIEIPAGTGMAPCRKCGEDILASFLVKSNGFCRDCAISAGFDESSLPAGVGGLRPPVLPKRKQGYVPKTIGMCIAGGFFCFIFFVFLLSSGSRGSQSATSPHSSQTTSREQRIEAYTRKQVNKNWRSMPNGNSREEAVRASTRIRGARTWEELDAAIEANIRDGI